MKRVKIAVDLGNNMLKACTIVNGKEHKVCLPNKIKYTDSISSKAKKLIVNSKIIYLGVGTLNNNVLKHTRQNLLEQVLVMIHELFPNETDLGVELRTGLPPKQFFNSSYLRAFEDNFVKKGKIEYSVNDISKKVEITSVDVYAECYSAFVAIADEITTKQPILSIDVGGGTTDLCNYTYDYEEDMYLPDDVHTIEHGSIEFCNIVADYFNSINNADIDAEYIDHLFKNDLKFIEYKDSQYAITDYIVSIKPVIDEMLNKITNKFGQLDRYAVPGFGGGFKIFNIVAKEYISTPIEVSEEKQFFGNSIGYLLQ